MKVRKGYILALFGYFASIFIAEIFYRTPLYNFSKRFEFEVNVYQNHTKITNFYKYFTYIGEKYFHYGIFVFIFTYFPLVDSIALLVNIQINIFFTGFLKQIYHNGRPFWEEYDYPNYTCTTSFGNPSGHSLSSASFYLTLWMILKNRKVNSRIIKCLTLIVTLLLIFLIILSRLYLGVHSLNQVIFGFTIGIGLFLFHEYIIRLYYLSNEDLCEIIFNQAMQIKLNSLLILSFILGLLTNIIIRYSENHSKSRKVTLLCNEYSSENNCLKQLLSLFAINGMLIGFYIYGNYFLSNKMLLNSFNKFKNKRMNLCILCIVILSIAIIAIPLNLIKMHNPYYKIILRYGVVYFILSFILYSLIIFISFIYSSNGSELITNEEENKPMQIEVNDIN